MDERFILLAVIDPRGTFFFVLLLATFCGASVQRNRVGQANIELYVSLCELSTYNSKRYCTQQMAFGTNTYYENLLILFKV
jgi:hypothetical protein